MTRNEWSRFIRNWPSRVDADACVICLRSQGRSGNPPSTSSNAVIHNRHELLNACVLGLCGFEHPDRSQTLLNYQLIILGATIELAAPPKFPRRNLCFALVAISLKQGVTESLRTIITVALTRTKFSITGSQNSVVTP